MQHRNSSTLASRWLRAIASILVTVAIGCTPGDQLVSPLIDILGEPDSLKIHSVSLTASESGTDRDVGLGGLSDCDLGSSACGYSKAYNATSTWEGEAQTYFRSDSLRGGVSLFGQLRVIRNSGPLTGAHMNLAILSCGRVAAVRAVEGCYDWDTLVNTCATEANRFEVTAHHVAVNFYGVAFVGDTKDEKSCAGPACGGGGGAGKSVV